ncbi:hypothetical protein HanHA89_Chr10g0397151 [Helianthus annuus]|nr:hypothetical protein HanHA89_Chr10g0397151 [Helianthus annuus]
MFGSADYLFSRIPFIKKNFLHPLFSADVGSPLLNSFCFLTLISKHAFQPQTLSPLYPFPYPFSSPAVTLPSSDCRTPPIVALLAIIVNSRYRQQSEIWCYFAEFWC